MRLLKFNNIFIDIDEDTAIGIDFQAYDIKEPGERKLSVSNSFSIPRTAKNMNTIGYAGDVQFASTTVYDSLECDYWVDAYKLINKGKVMIVSVNDRINVQLVERPTVWDLLTNVSWDDFQSDFLTWLQVNKGLPSLSSEYTGTFSTFLDGYLNTTEGLILPYYSGNLAQYDPLGGGSYLENATNIYLKYTSTTYSVNGQGGHFCAYVKTIFEYIEDTYDVNFGSTESFDYNIFQDAFGGSMYVPLRNITIKHTGTGYYFIYNNFQFLPYETTKAYESKTLYDMCKSYFKIFNCVIDKEDLVSENPNYLIRRFDDITNAEEVDFSDNYQDETVTFSPALPNYLQQNYIRFTNVFDNGNPLTNSKLITCLNKNLEPGDTSTTLFEIDSFVNNLVFTSSANLTQEESLETFSFFVSGGTISSITINSTELDVNISASKNMQLAEMYDLSSEYFTVDDMVSYPKAYVAKKWLTLVDISNLQFFKKYFVRELNGLFFLNKISGYNPDKSKEAVELEFIKLP